MIAATLKRSTLAVVAMVAAVSIVPAQLFEIPEAPALGTLELLGSKPEYPVVFKTEHVTLMVSLDYCLSWLKWHPPGMHPVLEHYSAVREVIPPSTIIELGPSSEPRGWGHFTELVLDAIQNRQVYCVDKVSGARVAVFDVRAWSDTRPCSSDSKQMCGEAGRTFYLPDGRVAFSVVDIAL